MTKNRVWQPNKKATTGKRYLTIASLVHRIELLEQVHHDSEEEIEKKLQKIFLSLLPAQGKDS